MNLLLSLQSVVVEWTTDLLMSFLNLQIFFRFTGNCSFLFLLLSLHIIYYCSSSSSPSSVPSSVEEQTSLDLLFPDIEMCWEFSPHGETRSMEEKKTHSFLRSSMETATWLESLGPSKVTLQIIDGSLVLTRARPSSCHNTPRPPPTALTVHPPFTPTLTPTQVDARSHHNHHEIISNTMWSSKGPSLSPRWSEGYWNGIYPILAFASLWNILVSRPSGTLFLWCGKKSKFYLALWAVEHTQMASTIWVIHNATVITWIMHSG